MDVGVAFSRAGQGFRVTVAAVGGAVWDAWTACEMSVRDLVIHVIAGNFFAVHLLDGASAEEAGAAAMRQLGSLDDLVTEAAAFPATLTVNVIGG